MRYCERSNPVLWTPVKIMLWQKFHDYRENSLTTEIGAINPVGTNLLVTHQTLITVVVLCASKIYDILVLLVMIFMPLAGGYFTVYKLLCIYYSSLQTIMIVTMVSQQLSEVQECLHPSQQGMDQREDL